MSTFYVHVGFPKTATSTLQMHLFNHHPEIDYLGKFIPGFGYRTAEIGDAVNQLVFADETMYRGTGVLRGLLEPVMQHSKQAAVLLSSESMVHPAATDRGIVARRIYEIFPQCRILITIREQIDCVKSFYGRHGRYGQYLFLEKTETELLKVPLPFEDWLKYNFRTLDKNFVGTIRYWEAISYYAQLFGKENVGVFLYEELIQNQSEFLRKLCEFLQVEDVALAGTLIQGQHENKNFSRGEVLFGNLAAKFPPRSGMVYPPGLDDMVPRWLQKFSRKQSLQFSAEATEQLRTLYGEGNIKLRESFDLPLDQFGYAL